MSTLHTAIFCFCLGFSQIVLGQQALKRNKQHTKFHYVQTNIHLGYLEEQGTDYIDFSNQGPATNINYRFLSKNQRLLQRGYTKLVAVRDLKAKFSLQFSGGIADQNLRNDVFSLHPQNLGLSLVTKWDRTSFFVGYNRVQFGHNPKIDPVSDFTANITRKDIGFNQDFGVFFKSPISSTLDVEFNASIGGTLSKPIVQYDSSTGDLAWIDINYKDTWLLTGRIGTPSFKSFEYGIMAMTGRLENSSLTDSSRFLNRIGIDLVKKHGEQWKVGMLAVVGNTKTDAQPTFWNYNVQHNVEYYIKGKYIINISNGLLIRDDSDTSTNIHGQWINSVSYVVSPHTRFRLHHFVNYAKASSPDFGVTFQFITGIGKR